MNASAETWGGEDAWENKLGNTRNLVRQELVSRQLAERLPPPTEDLQVLDVGCGQGTQLLRLARQGYHVTGVDISPKLLAIAQDELDTQKSEVQDRVTLREGSINDLGKVIDHQFDVVCCHGVLMYLPSLERSIRDLASVVAPGGLISVLTRNRFSIAMRAGMMGDWSEALDGFDARNYNNRVGVEDTRADEPREVIMALVKNKIRHIDWYGVRLFTDHWGDVEPPKDFEQLLAAEEEAGRRDPYRKLTSLTHTFGWKAD